MKLLRAVLLTFLLPTISYAGQPPTSTTTVIPSTFFGLHYYYGNPYPTISFGSMRLWDTNATRWQNMNTASGTYDFTNLDNVLSKIKSEGTPTDVLLTLGATPNFTLSGGSNISSDPTDTGCEYDPPAAGSCGVPTDIAASCTNTNGENNCDTHTNGTNQTWRSYLYNLAYHINGLSSSYQKVTSIEIWNEFTAEESGSPTYPVWEGTNTQMLRMALDANCIFTGRGTGCTAANMGVTAVGVLSSVLVTTPNSVMGNATDATQWGNYVKLSGALSNVDVAAVHTYTGGSMPESTVPSMYSTMSGYLATASSSCSDVQCWSTEGSWGSNTGLSGSDLQAGFVARYYLLGWSSGFQRMYWYNYTANNVGTLWVADGSGGCAMTNGCLTEAGTAYQTTYNWMVGASMSTLCASGGGSSTIWTCGLKTGSNPADLVVWDAASTCTTGSGCANYTITAGAYASYNTLDGNNHTISPSATSVSIGAEPIELIP